MPVMIDEGQPAFGYGSEALALHDAGLHGLNDVDPSLTMHQLPPGSPLSDSHKARGDRIRGFMDRRKDLGQDWV
jgi:hypothetical protein